MNNLKELITGEYNRNAPLIVVDNAVKREIIKLMASGDIEKSDGLKMLKADYLIFSFLGLMQVNRDPATIIYYAPEIRNWFEEIKESNINLNINEL